MRAFWNILPSLKSRATGRAGPYVWLSILAGCVGLILSLSAAFTVWHRANRLAELELTARASNYDQTLQFGINMYMRRVAALRSLLEIHKRQPGSVRKVQQAGPERPERHAGDVVGSTRDA